MNRVEIREIFNLQCTAGTQELGYNVALLPISEDLISVIDQRVTRLGGRWDPDTLQPWMLRTEYSVSDGGASSQQALNNALLAILLVLRPNASLPLPASIVKFGPFLHLESEDGEGWKIVVIHWDQFSSIVRDHTRPDQFSITEEDIVEVRRNFEQLMKWGAATLEVPLDWFVRACTDQKSENAIIDVSIALECLYSSNAESRACEGACFVGKNSAEREQIYEKLLVLKKARAQIMHEGITSPEIMLKSDGSVMRERQMRDFGISYLALALKKILNAPGYEAKSMRDLRNESKYQARIHRDECERFKTQYRQYYQ
jgi:hypothetical protein